MGTAIQGTLTGLSFDLIRTHDDDDEKTIPAPSLSSFSINGELHSYEHERYIGDRLVVQLVDPKTGDVIATSQAWMSSGRIVFHPQRKNEAAWTERAHNVKVGEVPLLHQDDE